MVFIDFERIFIEDEDPIPNMYVCMYVYSWQFYSHLKQHRALLFSQIGRVLHSSSAMNERSKERARAREQVVHYFFFFLMAYIDGATNFTTHGGTIMYTS